MRLSDMIGNKLERAAGRVATVGAGLTVALCFFGRMAEAIAAFAVAAALILLLLIAKAAAAHIKVRRPENAGVYKQDGHEVVRGVRL